MGATLASALEVTLGMEDLVRALLTLARKGGEEGIAVEAIDVEEAMAGTLGLLKRFNELSSYAPSAEELTPDFVRQLVPGEIEKFRLLLKDK